jgi:hypothetical protein
MNQTYARNRWPILVLALVGLLLLAAIMLLAGGQQISLPLTGLQSNRQVMPPDPGDWCRQVNLNKLQAEVARAETFFSEGVGENLVDWRYLRRALRYTGVQVNGPEDSYWLETIKSLYVDCSR